MKQTKKTLDVSKIDRVIALSTDDTLSSHEITIRSLADETVAATGYDPEQRYESLHLDEDKEDVYASKNDLLTLASSLSSRASSTIGTKMEEEERQETMAARYEKLLQVIHEYERAPAEVRYVVAGDLNKAIDAMNQEQASVDKPYTLTTEEEAFVDRVKHIQYLSSAASTEITDAFEQYKAMSPEAQQVVLPTIQNVYNSYMSFNRYEDEHAAVSDAYRELPKSFEHNITFSTDHLQYIGLTNEESTLRNQLNGINPQEMSHADVSKTLDDYAKLDSVSQTRLYGDYERIVSGYVASHPESAEMITTLQNQYLSNYASTELNRSETAIRESVERMNADTMSYESLVNTARVFDRVPDSSKATLYENYQDLVDRYVQAHPPVESYGDLKSSLIQSVVSDYTPPETLTPTQQSLHDTLSRVNPSTMSYESLDRMLTTYSRFGAEDKIALYGDYERLVTGYVEAHPRSENAETLQTILREDYVNAVTHRPHEMSAEDVAMREQMQAVKPGAMSYATLTDTVANFDNLSQSSKVALYETYAATVTGYESAHPLDRTPETIVPSMRETLMDKFKPALYNAEEHELRAQVSTYDVSKMSFAQLESVVHDFYNASDATRNALYNDYAGLIADYAESHPRKAAEAVELGQEMRNYQMELADNRHTHAILDDCRTLYDNTSVADRESNIVVANRILDTYAALEPADREAVRGIVLESVEKFNGFELERVVRPVERDPVETTTQRYSPAYYEIKDELVNGGGDAELGARAREELSLVEQRQIMSLSAARENPEFVAPIQQEINTVNMIRETLNRDADGNIVPVSDAAMEQYAKAFTELSPQNRELVLHDFVEKYNASSHSPELLARLDKIDGFGTALETAVTDGTHGMTMRQYESTVEMLGNLPPQISNDFYTSNVAPLATWENYVNDNLTNANRVERINEIFEGSKAFEAANIGDSFSAAAADKVAIAEIHELSSNVESFKKEDMIALFDKFEQHSGVGSYTSADVARAFSEFSDAHPRWAASPEIQERHVALVEASSSYAAATGAEFARSLEENPPANASAMKKQIAEFEQLPFEAKEHAIGALTTAYVAYEDHSKTLTLNEQFEKLGQVAMQPQVYGEIMSQFDNPARAVQEFRNMSPERQEEIYTFALDRCRQTGIIANSSEVPSADEDISVRFSNLMVKSFEAAEDKSRVFDDFVANNFDTTREGPIMLQYAEMSYDKKMELYEKLAADVVAADLDTRMISGNVKTVDGAVEIKPHSTVETQFEQTTGKYLEQCFNAGLIREQPMLESRLALSIGTNTDKLPYIEDYRTVPDNQHVASNIVSAATIVRTSMSDEIERERAAAEFKTDCKDLSYAVSHRNQIVYARTTDDLARAADNFNGTGISEGAREYLAVTYMNKVEGFYNSGATENQVYYGGFVAGENNNERIQLQIDGLVGPNCFIGHVPGMEDQRILVMTNEPIDIGVTRENRDIYSALSGIPVINATEALDSSAKFSFDDNKCIMDIPVPVNGDMENYQPASENVRQQFEVLNVANDGINGSILTVRNMETDQVMEIASSIKEKDIVNAMQPNVEISGDHVLIHNVHGPSAMATESSLIEHERALHSTLVNGVIDNSKEIAPELIGAETPDKFIYAEQMSVVIGDKTMPIESCTYNAETEQTIVGYKDGDETKYILVDKSLAEISNEMLLRDPDVTITSENTQMTVVNGFVALQYEHGDDLKFSTIRDISEQDGKAVFTAFDNNGQIVKIESELTFEQASATFENCFRRSEAIESIEMSSSQISFQKHGDQIFAHAVSSENSAFGQVINMTDNSVTIRDATHGLVVVQSTDGKLVDNLLAGENIVAIRNESELTIGNGTSTESIFNPDYSKNNSMNVSVVDADKEDFLKRSFNLEHLGSELTTSQIIDGKVTHGTISYMNAEMMDDNTIKMTVVEQVGRDMTAYQIEGITHSELRQFAELTKLHELNDPELRESLQRMQSTQAPDVADVTKVVNAFNEMQSDVIAIDSLKYQPQEGDLVRASIIENDGQLLLRAYDHEGHAHIFRDPVIKTENGEMFAYVSGEQKFEKGEDGKRQIVINDSEHGTDRYRIVSCAFGEFTNLSQETQKEFNWADIIERKENSFFQNVNVEYTVDTHLNTGGRDMHALFSEKIGVSCETTENHHISASHIQIDDDTKVALNYGVLIQDTKDGPHFTYFNPSQESTLFNVTTTDAATKYLPAEQIPTNAEDAQKNNFVLVDYEHCVAIKQGGLCYRLNEEDLNKVFAETGKPQNYYSDKIAEPLTSLEQHAQFVSSEKFAGATNDLQPSVNNWNINVSASGKPMLLFEEASASASTSTIGRSYEIKGITVEKDGTGIYAELVSPIANADNSTGSVSKVRLCMPTEQQFETMEKATARTIGDAGTKMQHYFEQINDLAKGIEKQVDTSKLERGKYVVVQDEADKPGVVYKVVTENSLMIVGGSDDTASHPTVLKGDAINGKIITQIDNISMQAQSQLRFENNTVYAEFNKDTSGKITGVTIGDRAILNDDKATEKVDGNTFTCQAHEVDRTEVAAVHDGDEVSF